MSARAFLTARPNSFVFEDRLLVLDQPAKVGRSHKDDRSDSGNCFFDCKVLSRAHAKFLFDEGKFYLVDTSSSNGSPTLRTSRGQDPTQLLSVTLRSE